MARDVRTPAGSYYDAAWQIKLGRPEYATLERRWRSRWDFVESRIPPGLHVLDIGCGDGVLGERLTKQHGCEVRGVDVSAYALEKAEARGVSGKVVDIDVDDLPFDVRSCYPSPQARSK